MEPLENREGKYRDWKTGNWYLYARPEPGTSIWQLRMAVDVEWFNYTSHPRWFRWEVTWEGRPHAEHPKM